MKKKIFSTEKFKEYCSKVGREQELVEHCLDTWVKKLIGLTEEQCKQKGYTTISEWFEEVEVPDKKEIGNVERLTELTKSELIIINRLVILRESPKDIAKDLNISRSLVARIAKSAISKLVSTVEDSEEVEENVGR